MPPLTDREHRRRRLALAADPEATIHDVACRLGIKPGTLRTWVAEHAPDLHRQPGKCNPDKTPSVAVVDDAILDAHARLVPIPGHPVVVWRDWRTDTGKRANQRLVLAESRQHDKDHPTHAEWRVDCVTCKRAWVADDAADAERIKAAHLAGVAS